MSTILGFQSRRFLAIMAILAISPSLPRHFSTFIANKTTYSIRRLGGPWVALAWRLGGPWVALGWPLGDPNPIPIPIGRGSQPFTKYQVPSTKYQPSG